MLRPRSKLESNRLGVAMIMPALILMLLLLIYPLIQGISYSFTSYRFNRPNATAFIGFSNYVDIITSDHKFYSTLGFTFLNALGAVLISYAAGFAIALLLNKKLHGRGLFRAVILLPWVISSSVTATNWQWMLNDRHGIVNVFLEKIGAVEDPVLFLANPTLAKFTVIIVGAWKCLPFMTVVILAGLQSISPDLYEAASIDGAGFWRSLKNITLPGIRGVTTMCTTLQFIWNFNNFENIYLLTSGGPNESTFTLPIYIYFTAFARNKIAYASAMAVLVMVIMMVFALIRFRLQRNAEE